MERAIRLATTWNARLAVVHAREAPIALSHVPSWREPPDPRALAREQLRLDLGAHAAGAEVIVERGKAVREGARMKTEEDARQHLAQARLATRNVAVLSEYGRPDALLRDLARTTSVDLLVTGRGHGRIAAFFLGSVSMSLLRAVPTDVMVVPAGTAIELARQAALRR